MLYRLARPELLTLLAAAEQVLAATGNAVALCPVYGDAAKQAVARRAAATFMVPRPRGSGVRSPQ